VHEFGSIDSLSPESSPLAGLRLCRATPVGSIPAGNVIQYFATLRRNRNIRELGFD
jgi:hypothetical protein